MICDGINEVPKIVFAKDAYFARKSIGQINCNVVGLDWTMDIAESRALVGNDKVLQGNMDPCALYGSYDSIKLNAEKMLKQFGNTKHIANLGHGLYPDLEKEKVQFLVKTIKEFKH